MKLKLSEAIRLGGLLHPQCFGNYLKTDRQWRIVATCALEGATRAGYHDDVDFLLTPAECPVCLRIEAVRIIVAHLNDHHRWTREAIADWVQVQEVAEVPAVVEAV